MAAPAEEEGGGESLENQEEAAPPTLSLRPADKYGLDIDAEFRKPKSRFKGWQDVAKTATEVVLDEIRARLGNP